MNRPPITTHVLDTSSGKPAAGVSVRLYIQEATDRWSILATGITNDDGRIGNLLPVDHVLKAGVYRMRFMTGDYFDHHQVSGFYPYADIVFTVREAGEHFHIPLLLSPYGYSTYRGS